MSGRLQPSTPAEALRMAIAEFKKFGDDNDFWGWEVTGKLAEMAHYLEAGEGRASEVWTWTVTGRYEQCLTCYVPMAVPWPEDWGLTLTIQQENLYLLEQTYRRSPLCRSLLITPHRGDCPTYLNRAHSEPYRLEILKGDRHE